MTEDQRAERWARWAFPSAVLLATVLGMDLRAWHLAIPLRYDEAVTFLEYASGGFRHAATAYPTPNNHVLHSLLVHVSTSVFGPSAFAVRLPAFLAGCLLVPATAWLAARRHGRRVAVLAAFLVAATPVLVEYSTNARGYAMVALATVAAVTVGEGLLTRPTLRGWVALGALGVAGLYTVPVMLLPWAGITVWLWTDLFLRDGTWRERLRREAPLVAVQATVALTVVSLYLPIVRANGLEALLGNRFVESLGGAGLVGALPGAVESVALQWSRAVPMPLVIVVVAGALAAMVLRSGREGRAPGRFPLSVSLLIGVAAVMAVKQNPGEARIWLWCLPLVLTAAAAGLTDIFRRTVRPKLATRLGAGLGAAWFTLTAVHLVADRPLWRSLETGGFMEVREVAAWLAPRVDEDDIVITDFVSWEPLRYYLVMEGLDPLTLQGRPGPDGRAWVILNRSEPERPPRAATTAASLGIPLGTARPMARFGPVDVFGFGAPGDPGGSDEAGDGGAGP